MTRRNEIIENLGFFDDPHEEACSIRNETSSARIADETNAATNLLIYLRHE
jgi:hypothetical protein